MDIVNIRRNKMSDNNTAFTGIQWSGVLGLSVAVTLSYAANKSILWAILHGACGWFYVIYHAIVY